MENQMIDNGIVYNRVGDYLLPELALPEQPEVTLGKYAMLRRKFLKNYRKGLYLSLKASGKLTQHLAETEQTALEQLDVLIAQMKKSQGVTEQMKAEDQMKWVGMMNNIRNSAEEIVLKNLIYNLK